MNQEIFFKKLYYKRGYNPTLTVLFFGTLSAGGTVVDTTTGAPTPFPLPLGFCQ